MQPNDSTDSQHNTIRLNSIHSNGSLGIDLAAWPHVDGVNANDPGDTDTGPNALQNFPEIAGASFDGANTTIIGSIHSIANTTFTIDLYGNATGDPTGHGEGETYLGTTTCPTDGSGDGTWTLVVSGDVTALVLSSTATDPIGNTSEFSAPPTPNTAPAAVDDDYEMYGDTLIVPAAGVLLNDTDADGDPLEAVLVDPPDHGSVTLNADGSFTYDLGSGFAGSDSFTYKANDGIADSNVATVSILHMLYVTNLDPYGVGSVGSLDWVIANANTHAGPDTVRFAVAGTIESGMWLHDTSGGTTIDGTSAPGYAGSPVVGIRGPGVTTNSFGVLITSSDNVVRALQIDSYDVGVRMEGADASNNQVAGCYVGTDGASALENLYGVYVMESAGSGNVIGTNGDGVDDAIEGNVISGSRQYGIWIRSPGNVVAGNYVGTDATGTLAIPNSAGSSYYAGVALRAEDNLLGTNADGISDELERNVISGNTGAGVYLWWYGHCTVAGNYIGTDATGMVALGNHDGISVGGQNNLLGTNGDGVRDEVERNVISGNNASGVYVSGGNCASNVIAGNYVGVNASGSAPLGNVGAGVVVGGGYDGRVGTNGDGVADDAERNIISGNQGLGVHVLWAPGTVIAGNYIGTDPTGTVAWANGLEGVRVYSVADGIHIGTDGNGVADAAERNIISGNIGGGISLSSSSDAVIAGNYIGMDVNGTAALPNAGYGVHAARGTGLRLGTDGDGVADAVERNVISGNAWAGVLLNGATGATVAGNFIGTDVSGLNAMGNGWDTATWLAQHGGVVVAGGSGHVIGGGTDAEANTLAFNTEDGVALLWDAGGLHPQNVAIRRNSIHSNGELGIDLGDDGVTGNESGDADTGPNGLQNWPVIASANFDGTNTTISGVLNSTASTTFVIDLYANTTGDPSGHGEGEFYLGTTTCMTDGSGNGAWSLPVSGDVTGLVLSSTATDPAGNTSEFSAAPPLNTPPLAVDDDYEMYGDVLVVPAAGVLLNDTDADGDPLEAVLVDPPSHGDLTLNEDGSFTYTPGAGFAGVDSFTYQADDAAALSNVATVSITHMLYVTNIDDSGTGSFRWTIDNANVHPGLDTIKFAVNGGGVQTIAPRSALPHITEPVIIDGTTQPGFAGTPIIELDGSNAGTGVDGLWITGGGSTVRGLVINRFAAGGIVFNSTVGGNVVEGNYIGTDVTGTVARGNGGGGVHFWYGGQGSRVGTNGDGFADDAERNLISANGSHGVSIYVAQDTVVAGNYIGTDVTGTVALGNGGDGVWISGHAQSNRVGTNGDGIADEAERNVISANGGSGVYTRSDHDVVAGNYIGTDATGTMALGNVGCGVSLIAQFGRVGTNGDGLADEAERNVVSGNGGGVSIAGGEDTIVAGNYIGTDVTGTVALGNAGDGLNINAIRTRVGTNSDGVADEAERNLISGNGGEGIDLYAGTAVVAGNYIGTDVTGTVALGNQGSAVRVRGGHNRVGTDGDGVLDVVERNILSGNRGYGVSVWGTGTQDNVVAGNYIGTDVSGTAKLGNGFGVAISGERNRVGTNGDGVADDAERNVISGNAGGGMAIGGHGNNVVAGNYIGTDFTGTVALGNSGYGIEVYTTHGNRIGTNGDGLADAAERNIIAASSMFGVAIFGSATENVLAGNYIGTDVTGTIAFGNGWDGVRISGSSQLNRIGTNGDGIGDEAERNLISGNGRCGVLIHGPGTDQNVVAGNYIGTDAAGTGPLGNSGSGVTITGSSNTIGGAGASAGNVIAYNQGNGVEVRSESAVGNRIQGNSIHSNGLLGIDFYLYLGSRGAVNPNDAGDADLGPNNLQNYPVIQAAAFDGTNTVISGLLNSTANTVFTIDVYANTAGDPSGYGEGEFYLGTTICMTDGSGNGAWSLPVSGDVREMVLATMATDPDGNTSEFSAPAPDNTAPVADAGPDQTLEQLGAAEEVTVILDGSGSYDPDGDPLVSYAWTGPFPEGGGTVHGVGPTVTLPVGTSIVTLVVNDGQVDSDPDAVQIFVNRHVWYVDDDAANDPGPNDNTVSDPDEDGSPAHPFDQIQEGIDAAGDGHTVLVAAGTYPERLTWDSKSIDLLGDGAADTIVDGGGLGRCLTISNVPDTAALEGFTFSGGSATNGGGLYLSKSSPTLARNIIQGNSALGWGGGLYVLDSSPAVVGNSVGENFAGSRGGGVCFFRSSGVLTGNSVEGNSTDLYGGGLDLLYSSPTLTGNTIAVNSAGEHGGGLNLHGSSSPLTGNTITGNSADGNGGGLHVIKSSPLLTQNTITENSAGGIGGGLSVYDASPTLAQNHISDNRSVWAGGGVWVQDSSAAIYDNAISGNSGIYGGGLYLNGGSVTVTGNLISGNSATQGGGVYLSLGSAMLTDNTIASNTATHGGGVCGWRVLSATLRENVISDNTAGGFGGGVKFWFSHVVLTDNLIEGNNAAQHGGGVDVHSWSLTAVGNTIVGNTAARCGGLLILECDATVTDNSIVGNTATELGAGGVSLYLSSVSLRDNTIRSNTGPGQTTSSFSAGGVEVFASSATLTANTIDANEGIGIWCYASSPTIEDNSINSNTADGIALSVWYESGGDPGQAHLDTLSEPEIVRNNISDNGEWGIRCVDTAAANVVTLEADNVLGVNGSGQVQQTWYGLVKVLNRDYSPAQGASVRVFDNDGDGMPDYGSPFTSSALGFAPDTADLADPTTWPAFTEFEVGNDGVRTYLTPQTIDASLGDAKGAVIHGWDGRYQIVEVRLNTPPIADAGGPYMGVEGTAVTFDASDSSDPDGQTLQYRWDFNNDGTWDTQYSTDPTATRTWYDDHSGTVVVEVFDGQYTDTAAASVEVDNAAPEITSFVNLSPFCGVAEGEEITVSGDFTDAGTLDTHTATVDWGDDSEPEEVTVVGSGGSYTVEGSHAYQYGGVYTISLSVEDDDEGSDLATTTAVITGAGINNGVLQIVGTRDDDHVTVNRQGNGLFKVHASFLPDKGGWRTFDSDGIDLIYMVLCHGDDHATIAGNIQTPAIVDGGPGDDHLNGGGGRNVLSGSLGNDMLNGGSAGDVLIGGYGADRLVAGSEDDILIAGWTVYDSDPDDGRPANDQALLSILEEWSNGGDYLDRVNSLRGSWLAEGTVGDDRAVDKLTGSSGLDWFLADLDGQDEDDDELTDRKPNELVDEVSSS